MGSGGNGQGKLGDRGKGSEEDFYQKGLMAEPLYFEPGPPGIPADLPPEEIADRKKRTAKMEETLKRYLSKIENGS